MYVHVYVYTLYTVSGHPYVRVHVHTQKGKINTRIKGTKTTVK